MSECTKHKATVTSLEEPDATKNQKRLVIRFWYSGSMCVRTYILTLERGGRSGYLLMLPLLHRLKVMDDGVHVSYALPGGMCHVPMMHVTCPMTHLLASLVLGGADWRRPPLSS